jgi:predicted nucleic acid-binding protein
VGLAVLDAGVLIGYWDRSDAHHEAARGMLTRSRAAGDDVVIPASALAESLVAAVRQDTVDRVRLFLARFPIDVIDLDIDIAEAAARLRAVHRTRLPLPDALVIATAQVIEADTLVTTDRGWPDPEALAFKGELIAL